MSYCLLSYQIFIRVQAMRSHRDLYLEPHNSFARRFRENTFLLIAYGDLIICLNQMNVCIKYCFCFSYNRRFVEHCSGRSRIFSEGASIPQAGVRTYHLAIFFSTKLHQKERNWTERRDARPWHLSWVCQFIIYSNLSLLNVSIIF